MIFYRHYLFIDFYMKCCSFFLLKPFVLCALLQADFFSDYNDMCTSCDVALGRNPHEIEQGWCVEKREREKDRGKTNCWRIFFSSFMKQICIFLLVQMNAAIFPFHVCNALRFITQHNQNWKEKRPAHTKQIIRSQWRYDARIGYAISKITVTANG